MAGAGAGADTKDALAPRGVIVHHEELHSFFFSCEDDTHTCALGNTEGRTA